MEAFQLLSGSGTHFNKTRFESDIRLFTNPASKIKRTTTSNATPSDIPAELDFFKYSRKITGKRKQQDPSSERNQDKGPEKRRNVNGEYGHFDPNVQLEEPDKTQVDECRQVKHKVTSKGENIPDPVDTFEGLDEEYRIPPQLYQNLSKNGYIYPTSIQSHATPVLFRSRDLAAISPTGTGKTLSYLLPIMTKLQVPISSIKNDTGLGGARALIIAPTRELAHQIYNECLKLAQCRKWRIVLFSKATAGTLAVKSVRDKVDIIISTPLRLATSVREGIVSLENIRHLVLDEADRLLDVEFLTQTQEVVSACTHPSIQKALFSATLPAGVEKIAMGMLQDPIRIVVGLKDTPLPHIEQSLTYVADDQSKLSSLLTYFAKPYIPPVLVFTSTQHRASSLAEELTLNGLPNVDCLHAGMSKKEREDAVHRMRQGQSWIMVSTEVMARGMDFRGLREIINYDFPTSVQSYVHRIGRAGRAGQEGKAVTFFTDQDAPFLKSIANVILQSGQTVPDWMINLPKPSKMKRKAMGKVKRPEIVNDARRIGRQDAVKRRDMIAGSKRRKDKAAAKLVD